MTIPADKARSARGPADRHPAAALPHSTAATPTAPAPATGNLPTQADPRSMDPAPPQRPSPAEASSNAASKSPRRASAVRHRRTCEDRAAAPESLSLADYPDPSDAAAAESARDNPAECA